MQLLLFLFGLLVSSSVMAGELIFTPPEGWVAAAPAGMVECSKGLSPRLTAKEARQFAVMNEIWPHEAWAVVSPADFVDSKVMRQPDPLTLWKNGKVRGRYKAEVEVIVGHNGEQLGRAVKCSNNEQFDQVILEFVGEYEFSPAKYLDRRLNSVVRIPFDLKF